MRNTTCMLAMLLSMACDAAVKPPEAPVEPIHEDAWTEANPTARGPAAINPEEAAGKEARRMSVDQLRRSIPLLFGGETWTMPFRGEQANAFDLLSRTLGEPDYVEVNDENREPSPLFAKYMDDMAGDVCTKAIARDETAGANDERLVMVEEDVDQNLRFLRLKLHGLYVPQDSTDGIAELRALFDDILAETSDARIAWYGVCVAMLTAPELMAY